MDEKISDFQILKDVFKRYIYGLPQVRILILPTLLCMLVAKYLEVKISDCTNYLFKALETGKLTNDIIIYFSTVTVVAVILVELQGFIFVPAIQKAFREASKNTFANFILLDPRIFNQIGSGEIQATIERKGKAVSEIMDILFLNLLPTLLLIVIATIKIISTLGYIPSLIINLTIAVYAIITIKIAIWRTKIRTQMNRHINKSHNLLYDNLGNYDTIVAYNTEEYEIDRYNSTLGHVESRASKLLRSMYLLNVGQNLIMAIQKIVIIYLGMNGLYMKRISGKDLGFYITISITLSSKLNNLGFLYCKYMQAMVNAKITYGVTKLHSEERLYSIREFTRQVKFVNLTVKYNEDVLFTNVSFAINKGEKVAIIGSNGVGKSTILKTLLKFNTYTGSIYIDDNDIQNISSSSLRSFISYVPQNPTLFNETIKYNIKYGNSRIDDGEMIRMAKKYKINDSITRLNEGYETLVGEMGKSLSGGERQKVALLRALLKETNFVVMDEPTAALDKVSEYEMFSQIVNLPNLTLLVVIHNLDLLPLFDKVVILGKFGVNEVTDMEKCNFKQLLKDK